MVRKRVVVCLTTLVSAGNSVEAATIRPGADPAPGRVIWAEPFDYYNQWAWDNRNDPSYPRGTLWQDGPIPAGSPTGGYPAKVPGPPSGCGSTEQSLPGNNQMMRNAWPQVMQCGALVTNAGFTTTIGNTRAMFDQRCGLSGEWVWTRGQYGVAFYTWGTGGANDAMLMFQHSFRSRIQAIDPTKNAVNGTDENPLVLVFYVADGAFPSNPGLSPLKDNSYVELSLEGDHAPVDYVWRGDPNKTFPDPDGCPQGPFPVICQQAREVNSSGSEDGSDLTWLNANCPPLKTRTWKSLAFGFLAIMDKDPCGVLEQGSDMHCPNVDHHAVFDGNKWRQMRSGRFPALQPGYNQLAPNPPYWYDPNMHRSETGTCNDFSFQGDGVDPTQRVTIKIISDWMLIYVNNAAGDWHAAVPRVYKGPFDTVSYGVAPGCELDPATGECKADGTPYRCLTYSRATHGANNLVNGYNRTSYDTMSLYDGELVYVTTDGACCLPDGTCSVQDELDCQAAGGTFGGQGVFCNQVTCCPHDPFVWADRDADGDVDADDFGGFQICYSGPGGGVSGTCKCFNRDNDNDVDVDDLTAFTNCVTGANVPYGPGFPAACVP